MAMEGSPDCSDISSPETPPTITTASCSSSSSSTPKSPAKSPLNTPLLPPCRVCGGKASGFHYGANTCEACKGFFRRSLKRKTEYRCMANGKCQIMGRRKNNTCARCRWNRCLSIGMSKAAIKTGRYTHEKKTRDIVEIKAIQEQKKQTGCMTAEEMLPLDTKSWHQMPMSVDRSSLPDQTMDSASCSEFSPKIKLEPCSASFSPQERTHDMALDASPQPQELELEEIISHVSSVYEKHTYFTEEVIAKMPAREKEFLEQQALQRKMFGPMKPLPKEEYMQIYQNTGLDIDGRKAMMQRLISRVEDSTKKLISFAKSLPGFTDLSVNDQIALLKCGKVDTHFILTYKRYNVQHRLVHSPSSKIYGIEELTKLDSIELWELRFKIAEMIFKLDISREEMVMMAGVCFLMVDRCKLEDKEKVESSLQKCLDCLLYLLRKNHSEEPFLFPRVVAVLTELRNLADKDLVIENLEQVTDMVLPPLYQELINKD